MANPPITIGPFTNVPAPGSPIKSDWPQSISTFVTALPRGWIGHAFNSADQTGIGAGATDVTGLSVAWTADPTRRYRVSASVQVQGTVSPSSATVSITNPAGSPLNRKATSIAYANAIAMVTVDYIESGLSGAQTRKVQAQISAGAATVAGGSNAAWLIVQDIGKV